MAPRTRIPAAVAREGERGFVGRCLEVLAMRSAGTTLLEILGGTSARRLMAAGGAVLVVRSRG